MKRTFDYRTEAAFSSNEAITTSASPAPSLDSIDARQRLLLAALDLFGTRGFSETSIRELALAANVNLAAVNYYFGSKENLHMEALRYGFAPTTDIASQLASLRDDAHAAGTTEAAEEALRRYVEIFLSQVLAENHKHWNMVLREQLTPGPAFEMVMKDYLEPLGRGLYGIVALLLPGVSGRTCGLCVRSIIGQCVHLRYAIGIAHYFNRHSSLSDKPPFREPSFIGESSEHISEFSIQALRGMRSEYKEQSAKTVRTKAVGKDKTSSQPAARK
ncbi:MAG TPA: CerR family C-terminal domain-containing protein [Acidisarcina sp.]